jgi:hypothetical protein
VTKDQVKREAAWAFVRSLVAAFWIFAGGTLWMNGVRTVHSGFVVVTGLVVGVMSVVTMALARYRILKGVHD